VAIFVGVNRPDNTIDWQGGEVHVGDSIQVPKGARVMTFQADGDELDLILEVFARRAKS